MEQRSNESLKSEVEELRSALTTVTEALILFQEFIESEIGEMSYFRDSGSYYKLVDTLNKMRVVTALKVSSPLIKPTLRQYRHSTADTDDEEQVEVDVDYNDDDPVGEITIRQVFSVPSPEKDADENLHKRSNSAITITPVYPDEKKREQPQFGFPQPQATMIIVDKNGPPPFLPTTDASFLLIDNQRVMPSSSSAMKLDARGNEKLGKGNRKNSFGLANSLPSLMPITSSVVPAHMNQKSSKKGMKKSLLRMNNPSKKKLKKEGPNGTPPSVTNDARNNRSNGIDKPLNLKKKIKRPSDTPVKCESCGKSYSSKGVLSRHIKEAHKADPQFPCFYCPFKFRNGPARLEHMNTFHPEDMNSVICPYCKRNSSSVAGKRNHMMLCARKHRLVQGNLPLALTNKSSPKMAATSPSDSGVDMDAKSSS